MPHIRLRAVSTEVAKKVSQTAPDLAVAANTAVDNFTFELVATQFFTDGQPTESYPFVEVLLFPRPAEVKQKMTDIITNTIKAHGSYEDVIVLFQELNKDFYFENGKHF
ncbi:DUF1904 family protein [Bdellovibrio sp. NC01]|uniref:DUF1904 family protein n=1 Tax=Bdellovibrio sp. NC01 TaxID=2220073 RepID=UPI00115C43F5|nr:DUF1904 family protein [Bdellovibrio sp. NC01]QDK38423.1 DUF1904 domain-containing protein [Bdellovibrio sp. NC01]